MRRLFVLLLIGCGSNDGPPGPGTIDAPPGGGPDGPPLVVEDAGPGDQPRFVEYIRATPYPALRLEIDIVPGWEPRNGVENDLIAGLTGLLDKPGGITSVHDDALMSMGADHAWTFAELNAMAQATFDDGAGPDTISMHLMFVDGHHADDSDTGRILGIAWGHTHIVMFAQTIEETCANALGLVGPVRDRMCTAAHLSILTHEVGHLLGLVDNGLPMVEPHKDPDHGAHDVDDACVMYWAYEGADVVDVLVTRFLAGNEAPLGFDAACEADVAAVR